jgi:dextranase
LQVADDPLQRLRYGFVADYRPGRDVEALRDTVRRLHLTGVQFYDWAYRHADLVGGGEEYEDPLGQAISLTTVRRMVGALHEVGALALGYAAVYGVGNAQWARWQDLALLDPGGAPYALGDFLRLVDPAAPRWLDHFTADLRAAVERLGLDGFHLDQYGYPKLAVRPDGAVVDLAASLDVVIRAVRDSLPDARVVFNNVNDFPTATTARAPQDATYVEVWPPQVTLGSLAAIVLRARAVAPSRPVVVAAYQQVYTTAPADVADRAAGLTLATLASHGATQLLVGEADRLLVDPYYVRNHVMQASTAAMLRRWFDFIVEHDELLFDPDAVDVTASWVGPYNGDLDVSYARHEVTEQPVPGAVWRRVVQVGGRLVVHLVNLAGQADQLWDAPRQPPAELGVGTLRVRRVGEGIPRIRVADPDRHPRLEDVRVAVDGSQATAGLPAPHLWQIIIVDPYAD